MKYLEEIFVQGVRIQLTPSQISIIKKELKKRESGRRSFATVLKLFGFKQETEAKDCFTHEEMGWFATIIDYGRWSEVWMTGRGLKNSSGFPGGWTYSEPKEIEDEIVKALNNK